MSAKDIQAKVIDTGSTNRAGMTVMVSAKGHATVTIRGMEPKEVKLEEPICRQLIKDLKGAAPVSGLPQHHCAKSVSFGSRLFVEYEGQRSPDLSCPAEEGASAVLQKDAGDILRAAREAMGFPANGMPIGRPLRPVQR